MKYEAAIFDLDGTLIDSTGTWFDIIKKICDILKIDEKAITSLFEETVYMTPKEFIEFIKKKFSLEQSVLEIRNVWLSVAKHYYSHEIDLKKGVLRLLNLMKENSIKMAIATSGCFELTEIVLKRWKIFDMFSCLMYSEKLNTNKKSADVYISAAEGLCVPCEKCGVFEDISFPIKKVLECKMGYFAVYDKNRSERTAKELKENATLYIKDYDKFIDDGDFARFFKLKEC